MKYQEFYPSNNFQDIIDAYWVTQNNTKEKSQKILPDACVDIVFNFGKNIFSKNKTENSVPKESIAIIGMMIKYSD
ncbi:MAG: hypothetical protein K8R58_02745, partial [Bacteroidales bacterium]|nr:hypothetical protein [Bacteroidales bacterium]